MSEIKDNKHNNYNEKDCSAANKNLIWTVISIILAVFTIRFVLLQSEDLSVNELMEIIRTSDKLFLMFGIAASVMYVWFEGVAIRSVLKKIGYPRGPFNGLLYSTADVYFSAVTPSATGGQPAAAFFMLRDGIPAEMTAAVLVLNLMMYTASIVVLGVFAIVICPGAFKEFSTFSKLLIAIGFIALSLLSVAFFCLLKKGNVIVNQISRFIILLHNKKMIRETKRKLLRLKKAANDYRLCSEMISGRKKILLSSFWWNLLQRAVQLMVPMLIYCSLGGEKNGMAIVFSKQCLVTIGYNFVPVPGGIGISDYLMLDGFSRIMSEQMAYSVELISRGITFYFCVLISGLITLAGYFIGRNKN